MSPTEPSDPGAGGRTLLADEAEAAAAGRPAPPATTASYGWPSWLRRTIIAALLVGCVGLIAYGNHRSIVGHTQPGGDPHVLAQVPPPGGNIPRQAAVTVQLQPGYDGRLTINGVAIPEAQMVGARDPDQVSAADLRQNGLRPNNHDTVAFQPGPGKVFTHFPTGTIVISVQYFKDRQAHNTGGTATWTASVD